jgi:hypothetical protein
VVPNEDLAKKDHKYEKLDSFEKYKKDNQKYSNDENKYR